MRWILPAVAFICLCSVVPPAALAQFTNVRVSDPGYVDYPPEEVVISINPADPLNIAAGANVTYYYYSTDGGYTWTQGNLTSTYGVWGDPCVTFDALGNLYFAHLSWPNQTAGDWLDRIVVQKSTNGGMTWDNGVGVGYNPPKDQDKEWIAADKTGSVYHNNLYMAWTEFDDLETPSSGDSTRIVFSRSTDQGATWSAPIQVGERQGNCYDGNLTVEGAVPAVGPNGEIYMAWAGYNKIYFDKSLDGGVTWGTDVVIAQQVAGWNFSVPGIYRCNGFPITLCDAGNSAYRGHIYVVYSDQPNGPGDTDIFFVKSTDGGTNWSAPQEVIQEAQPRHQFFPWAALDPTTGGLYVDFYDRRYVGGDTTEVF
ncbi:MAG: sialidase family protein, partial [Candidatus Latescibacterota bacterium]